MGVGPRQLSPMSANDICYLAGLFDGEGCIQIVSRASADDSRSYHTLRLRIAMTDFYTIEKVYDMTGMGYLFVPKILPGNKPVLVWTVDGSQAEQILKKLQPHLNAKQEEAEVALAFAKAYRRGTTRVKKYINKLHELKKRFLWPKAADLVVKLTERFAEMEVDEEEMRVIDESE